MHKIVRRFRSDTAFNNLVKSLRIYLTNFSVRDIQEALYMIIALDIEDGIEEKD